MLGPGDCRRGFDSCPGLRRASPSGRAESALAGSGRGCTGAQEDKSRPHKGCQRARSCGQPSTRQTEGQFEFVMATNKQK